MSQQQVEQLQALLSRISNNRKLPRAANTQMSAAMPAAGAKRRDDTEIVPIRREAELAPSISPAAVAAVGSPAAVAAPMAAAPMARDERAGLIEEYELPDSDVPLRASVTRPHPQAAAEAPKRKLHRDRSATPLELAVETELSRPIAATAPTPAQPSAANARATAQTERLMPAVQPNMPESNLEMPLELDAEPIAQPARPIAQVVSKHAPQLDATFGAMLKRSLSLRPH